MTEPANQVARAAGEQLALVYGPGLPVEVEAAIHASGTPLPDRYVDPVAVGALIVSVATLAWTVYMDLRRQAATPGRDVLARTVRVRLDEGISLDPAARDQIIDVVVTEVIRTAAESNGRR
jgi:hypothetical protein